MPSTKTGNCILCGNILTSDTASAEHVIPNAIGGRRRVTGFMCRSCNSSSGSMWDAELARQLNPISLLLGIKRQRRDVPSQTFPTYKGGSVQLNADGKMTLGRPNIQKVQDGNTTILHVEARTRNELKRILKGMRRKYPQINHLDLEEMVSTASERAYYNQDPMEIDITLGGPGSGRALVKSAIALVFDAGVDPKQCDLALDYLMNEDGEPCFGYYYDKNKDLLIDRPPKTPMHCVYVEGNSEKSTIVAYIEYYSIWRTVLCLSRSYFGRDFTHTYAINPISGEQLDIAINFDLSLSDIREAYEYKKYDTDSALTAIAAVLDQAQEIGFNRSRDAAIKYAVKDAFGKSGAKEGDTLTDEQISQLSSDIVDGMTPFLIHNLTLYDGLLEIARDKGIKLFPRQSRAELESLDRPFG